MKSSPLVIIASTMAALAISSAPVFAQARVAPRVSVAGGYAFVHDYGADANLSRGAFLSPVVSVTRSLGIAGELSVGTRSLDFPVESSTVDVTTTIQTIMVGGQYARDVLGWRLRGRAMGGVARETGAVTIFRVSVAEAVTKPVIQAGVGVEVPVRGRLAADVSLDYRRIFSNGYRANNQMRLGLGLAVGFGARSQ